MSVTLNLNVTDTASERLRALLAGLTDRTRLHGSIASEAENMTRDYLRGEVPKRHKTAQRLGASPTDHLSRAAESVHSASDANEASVSVTSPGMARAFGDVTIKPSAGKKFLTLPAIAEAYGRRAGSFHDLRLVVFGNTGLGALIKAGQKAADGLSLVYYWLKQSVHQKQDRTLLPSDEQYQQAAEQGAIDFVKLMQAAQQQST